MSRLTCMLQSALSFARRHWPTGVVMMLVAVALVLINLSAYWEARRRLETNNNFGELRFVTFVDLAYGWPLPYLYRSSGKSEWLGTGSPVQFISNSPWHLSDSVLEFNARSLAIDVLVGLCLVVASAVLVHRWRHRKPQGWRFSLRTLFAALTIGGLGLGWFALQLSNDAIQQRVLASTSLSQENYYPMVFSPFRYGNSTWEPFGYHWFHTVPGGGRLHRFARLVEVEVEGNDLVHLRELPHLRYVRLHGEATNEQLSHLAELPYLESLEAIGSYEANEPLDPDEIKVGLGLPPMPRLRILSLERSTCRGPSFAHLPSLQALNLSNAECDTAAMKSLGSLAELRRLTLRGSNFDDRGMEGLGKLQKLVWLDLLCADITRAKLDQLSGLTNLEFLALHELHREDISCLRDMKALSVLEVGVHYGMDKQGREELERLHDLVSDGLGNYAKRAPQEQGRASQP